VVVALALDAELRNAVLEELIGGQLRNRLIRALEILDLIKILGNKSGGRDSKRRGTLSMRKLISFTIKRF